MKTILTTLAIWLAAAGACSALDHVTFRHDGTRRQVDGRVVVRATDGGLLLQGRDGVLWRIPSDDKISHTNDEEPFVPFTRDELAATLRAQLPNEFDVHKTAHYLVLHNSSNAYARWCGALFERLYKAFSNYWRRRGFDLPEPEFPLVAVVFGDRASYLQHARSELGVNATSIVGYYHLETNRMTMCDLTGISSLVRGQRIRNTAQINEILSRPVSLVTVATVVHEATHQIAYNRGMHTRLGDCPLWLAEGVATFFETPDLSSAKGWQGVGEVNGLRLARFVQYCQRRPADSLSTLIADDKRFREGTGIEDAYAETWALTYFLVHNRSDQYRKYLKQIGQKKPLRWDSPEKRLAEFQEIFGDLETLDRDFLRYIGRLL